MKLTGKITLALFAAAAFCSTAFAAGRLDNIMKAGKITLATEPYFAPYVFLDNTKTGQDQFVGADMALGRYIAQKLGIQLEIVPLAWDAMLAGIAQGKYDIAIGGLAYTPMRGRSLEMSKGYQPGADQGVLVRKEDAEKYKSWDDFKGKKVGAHQGTLQDQLVDLNLKKSKKTVYTSVNDAVLAVDAGKIDAVAVAFPNGKMFMASHPTLQLLPLVFEQENSGVCVAATKGEKELIAKINEILEEVVAQDLYTKWTEEATEQAAKLGIK